MTDDTPAILAAWAQCDARIRLVSQPNGGLTRTLNTGVGLARAAYVAIMNADDVALPARLERLAAFLDAHPWVIAVGSATRTFANERTKTVIAVLPADPAALQSPMAKISPLVHLAAMFRRQAVSDVGLHRPQLEPAED